MPKNALPVDDLEPFESAFTLIGAAQASTARLESLVHEFRQQNKAEIVQRSDLAAGENIASVAYRERVSPEIRQTASSIVSDLRHALDHAIGDAAVATGPRDSKGVYFPICEAAPDFESEVKRKCREVHPDLIAYTRALQPYKGGESEILWMLSKLAGFGKHRRVLPLVFAVREIWVQAGSTLRITYSGHHATANKEIEIARGVSEDAEELGVSYKLIVNPDAVGRVSSGRETVASDFSDAVRNVVLGLKAETERIAGASSWQCNGYPNSSGSDP